MFFNFKVLIPEQPVDPLATIVPLLFVVVVTAIKQVEYLKIFLYNVK